MSARPAPPGFPSPTGGHPAPEDAVAPSGARQRRAVVAENRPIARDTFLLRLDDPETAAAIRPGQFVMIRPETGTDPLLGRPFALYDILRDRSGAAMGLTIVYQVVGKGTAWLAGRSPGEGVSVWGPLGNGFGPPPVGSVIFVAGGIGQTPFLALGRRWLGRECYGDDPREPGARAASVRLLYGVRSAPYLAGLDDFDAADIPVEVATDDGSAGHHGFVTDLLDRRLGAEARPVLVVACGPPPMLAAVARRTERAGVECLLSLENHMACGLGACFSCVTPIRQPDGSTDLRRVCVEGPVFDARAVAFD